VGEQSITISEFQAQCAFMGLGGKPSALAPELRQAVLETIIQRRIIMEQAQSRSIRLEPEELDREEASLRRGLSEDAFERTLAAQGIEYEAWRQVLAQELLMHKTLDLLLSSQVRISPEEVRTYYQEHREDFRRPEQVLAQHALLPNLEMAQKLLQRVQAGEDMGRAASDLEVPLADEGEPLWLARGHMPGGLENKVFALEPGKLAGPLASSYGYHVVRVLAKRPASDLDLTQAAEEIQRRLAADKKELLAGSFLEELRGKTQVWCDPGFLESGQLGK
jgi:peptidyl-prolyl cis-trans isomerase C